MSFYKEQVSFPSSFASIFCAIKDNSSILFLAQTLYTFFVNMNLNLHFTSRKNIGKKNTDKQNTRLPDTNILESNWEYKIANNNNKYICKTES